MTQSGRRALCHVWDCEYPWDVRVEKLSRALSACDFDVHLVARNRRRDPIHEVLPEAEIHRLEPWPWLPSSWDARLQFPAFFNPRWYSRISRTISSQHSRAVLVRDLPLAPTSIMAARRWRIPVILDMAENYPAMIQAIWDTGAQGAFDAVVRNPRIVRAVERWVLKRVDHVLVVCDESAARIEKLGVPSQRISIVSNTPDSFGHHGSIPKVAEGSTLRVGYLGLIEAMRGLDTVVDAIGVLQARGVRAELSVIGDGPYLPMLTQRIHRESLTEHVKLLGRLPHGEALERMKHFHLGVVPHFKNEMSDTTIPNKLFDYMAAGIPVVAASAEPLARVINATGCGAVFDSGDVLSCADAIASLCSPESREAAASAGLSAIRMTYNWQADAQRLCIAVKSVLTQQEGNQFMADSSERLTSTRTRSRS